jgi:hypothetical protein
MSILLRKAKTASFVSVGKSHIQKIRNPQGGYLIPSHGKIIGLPRIFGIARNPHNTLNINFFLLLGFLQPC